MVQRVPATVIGAMRNPPFWAESAPFCWWVLFQEILSQFGRNPHVLWRPMAKRQVLNFHGAEITWSCDWAPGEAA